MKLGNVGKGRLEQVCDLVNRAFTEAGHLQEFYWIIQNRAVELPETYQKVLKSRPLIGEFWKNGKKRYGVAIEYEQLANLFKSME